MISNISFNGHVFLTGNTPNIVRDKELNTIQKYSDDNDCDVVVLNRDYYSDGTGQYKTIVVKEDKYTGSNLLYKKVFDFMYPKKFKPEPKPVSYNASELLDYNFFKSN